MGDKYKKLSFTSGYFYDIIIPYDKKISILIGENKMANKVLVETSARHVHLTQETVEILFGKGHTLTKKKEAEVGRNDLCPCGSGKKYKKCCGAPDKINQ